ncbi:restriction endonuclease subunit S [Caldifermentibacillus hisashii]|uniref:restriction endonuclease subunit S n=1 Tax=Caldifermentibacillus hisashii TaxID=996558 RepID=UPI003134AC47
MVFDKWNECSLGELANLKYGKTIRKKELSDDGYPVFSGYAIVGYLPTFDYEEPQLIIVCRGVGGTGDIKLSPAKSSITNLSIIIDSDPSKIDKSFLYWYLKHADTHSLRTGSAQPQIVIKDLEKFKIKIPPMSEQKAIANILSTLDEKIETNNQINEKLEEMAQALFKHWFVDFEFPNENGKPYKSSGGEMVESELGMIPKGWKVSKLSELITLYDSKRIPLSKNERDKREKIYPYYGASSLMDYVDDYIFDGVYVLLGEDGTVIDELGYPILQYVWGKFWVNNHAHVIKGKNDYSEEFVYMLLKNTNVSSAVTGAVQLKINQKNLKNLSVVIPEDTDLIKQFSGILNYQFSIIRNNSDQNKVLTSIRDNLLPKLMSGEIRVPLDDEVLSEQN